MVLKAFFQKKKLFALGLLERGQRAVRERKHSKYLLVVIKYYAYLERRHLFVLHSSYHLQSISRPSDHGHIPRIERVLVNERKWRESRSSLEIVRCSNICQRECNSAKTRRHRGEREQREQKNPKISFTGARRRTPFCVLRNFNHPRRKKDS